MNEIGLLVSTFGGAGLFIWYLINRETTVSKTQLEKLGSILESLDDLCLLVLDLMDVINHDYKKKRNVKALADRIAERKATNK